MGLSNKLHGMNAESAIRHHRTEMNYVGRSIYFSNDRGHMIVYRSQNDCENDEKNWYDCKTGEVVKDQSIRKTFYYFTNKIGGLADSDVWIRNLKVIITKKSRKIPEYRKKGLETFWLYVSFDDVGYYSEEELCEYVRRLNASLDNQFDIIILSTSKALYVIGETITIYDAGEYKIKDEEIDRVLMQKSDLSCH